MIDKFRGFEIIETRPFALLAQVIFSRPQIGAFCSVDRCPKHGDWLAADKG